MTTITLRDGSALYVREIGKGKPVLVLHGFGMDSSHWLPSLIPLAGKYRFIIPDLRGFGKSHSVRHNNPCVLTNYAEDIQDILDHYQRPMPLVGLSLGAFAAMQYHRLFGFDRITRYMNIDQAPHVLPETDWHWGLFGKQGLGRLSEMRQLLTDLRQYGEHFPYAELPLTLRHAMWHSLGDFIASALTRQYQKRLVRRVCRHENIITRLFPIDNWFAYVTCIAAYLERDYDMRPYLSSIDIPVTVVAGYRSEMYPWEGQVFMHSQIKSSKLETFRNSGHVPMLDEPIHFLRTLDSFLKEG